MSKETKIALVVIYNHRFDKNIPIVEKVYGDRFSHIHHVIPFYDGTAENVIPVYESSFFFQGYIAQAYQHLKNKGYTHYLFIGDDVFLEPSIHEQNIFSSFKISVEDCYMPHCTQFHKLSKYWRRTSEACMYDINIKGVEISKVLPSNEDAYLSFQKFGIEFKPIRFSQFFALRKDFLSFFFKNFYHGILTVFKFIKNPRGIRLNYPMVASQSDIFITTEEVMPKFSMYLGAFSATKLFVEIAIPTALYLSAKRIKTNKDLHLKGTWTTTDFPDIVDYNIMTFKDLVDNFPQGYTYLHPIKFSKW